MLRRTLVGTALVAMLLLLGSSRPVAAQGLASLAAVPAGSSMAVEKAAGCWECASFMGFGLCAGGNIPGYYNCTSTDITGSCYASSGGCGVSAMMPLDPDGATQLVSRGSLLGIQVVLLPGDPNVRRNCDGVVVARFQSPDDITEVRTRTGTLSL